MTVAAFDIGSHTVTMVVMSADGTVLESRVAVSALARGLEATGELAPDAIERVAAILSFGREAAERHRATTIVATITEAGRRASNTDALLAAIAQRLGVAGTVIDPETEAQLSWRGAFEGRHVPPSGELRGLIDIGGGSTEIALGTNTDKPDSTRSMPFGSARLTATELHHDPPLPAELTNAIGLAFDHTDDVAREIPRIGDVTQWVGVAGTIVTVAAVEIGLISWDEGAVDGFRLTRSAAEDVFRTLATESRADRAHNPGLPADRVEVIVGGCCALVAIMRRLQLDEITVSTRGLAHGLARMTLETIDRSGAAE